MLRSIAELSDQEADLVWQVIAEEMQCEFRAKIEELRHSFEEMDKAKKENDQGGAAAKFQTIKASAGTVKDFHKGLAGRVGSIHLSRPQSLVHSSNVSELGYRADLAVNGILFN